MKLKVNRYLIRSGEIVNVSWDAGSGVTDADLHIVIGGKRSVLRVSPSGEKRFRLNGGWAVNRIGLSSAEGGKTAWRTVLSFGKKSSAVEYDSYTRQSQSGTYLETVKRMWRSMGTERQRLYIILAILSAVLLTAESHPRFSHISVIAAFVYTAYCIFRK